MAGAFNPGNSQTLAGKIAYVVISGIDIGPALMSGLEAQGARAILIADTAIGADVQRIQASFTSRDAVDSAFSEAAAKLGKADLVVHAAAPVATLQTAPLAGMDEADFNNSDRALKATLYTLQAAHGQMIVHGGAIIVLGPALSLVGAKQLVPLCTASEGQRSLVKSAARQWGHLGITVNWVAAADAQYAPALAGKGPEVPELGPPPRALGKAPELARDIAPVLAFIGSSAGRCVTGASINLDGGDWMTP